MKIQGETDGLRKSILQQLEAVYDFEIPPGQISTRELVETVLEITEKINREIAVYINRRGKVVQVAIGDVKTVGLPEIEGRKSAQRLSGIRCVHTHPNGDCRLSGPDLSALKQMRFDLMMAVAKYEGRVCAQSGVLTGEQDENGALIAEVIGPTELTEMQTINLTYLTTMIDKQLTADTSRSTDSDQERAILAGLDTAKGQSLWNVEDSMQELSQLAETAGAEVLEMVVQKRPAPDNALFFGKGKLEELALMIQEQRATLVIFDDELSPSQQRNLERMLGIKVLDRTALILDIFAQRARSHEGKLQVELAQLRYHLPRIGGQGLVLSRLGGGIGTRGPGETKLEVDKRHIRSRIRDIEKQIDSVKKHRDLHRENRAAANLPTVALVGYTNAGKSTLLNTLTASDVFAEDKLFATLDPTTRKLVLDNGREILMTDTVGFIQKLPHTLVSAFRATLEEVNAADLLLHIIDASHINCEQQIASVVSVLQELGADQKPMIHVYNKIDKIESKIQLNKFLDRPDSIGISAKKRICLDHLLETLAVAFAAQRRDETLLIPYDDGAVAADLHDTSLISKMEYRDTGTYIRASIPVEYYDRYRKYKIEEP